MEDSKLYLKIGILVFMIVSVTNKGFSNLKFQRQLVLSRYYTVFRLMHKIGALMGRMDSFYLL
jgi:hypothetical protein